MQTIISSVWQHALRSPEKKAIVADDGTATYRELFEYVEAFSEVLKAEGITKGDRVVVQSGHSLAFVIACLGTHLSGGVFVPTEKGISEENFKDIIERTSSKCTFVQGNLPGKSLSETIKNLTIKPFDKKNEPVFVEPGDTADILFTTGTTGRPEGIIHTQGSHFATVENLMGVLNMKEDNVCMITAPINHAFALRRFYANLVNGSTIVLLDGLFPVKKFFEAIEANHVNAITMVPSALTFLLKTTKDMFAQYADQITYLQFASAPLLKNDIEKILELLPNTHIYNIYGSTESGCVCAIDYNAHREKSNCIGSPTKNATIHLIGPDGEEVKGIGPENTGLVAASGPMHMKGYWDSPSRTSSVFKDGMIVTQDIGYRDEEGFYYFVSRAGDVINVGGHKVAPNEIEEVVLKFPGIADCACVAKKDSMAGQVPLLFIVPDKGMEYDKTALFNFLVKNLESFKRPKFIEIIEKIPRTFNGKILRRKLLELVN